MKHAIILPILAPLIAAIICLAGHKRGLGFQRLISFISVLIMPVLAVVLLVSAARDEITVYALGDWRAPFGIVLVLDRLAAAMLMLTSVLAIPALIYAMAGTDGKGKHFHPLFQFQLVGLNGAFLTGDIFNLFVFFEVLLFASYGLLAHGGGLMRAKASVAYVVLNVAGSTLFLVALAFIYGMLGTLNIADMAWVLPQVPLADQSIVRTAFALLIVVFGLKAALVPLSFWLPLTYGAAAAAVAALFAILTKVGIYALLRLATIVMPAAGFTATLFEPWLVQVAIGTIALGTLGVMAASRLSVVVAYLVVLSTGSLLAVIATPGVSSVSAAIYYLLHSTLVTAGFFLLADAIANQRGELLDKLERGPKIRQKQLGTAFLIMTIAVSGLPPLSGFLGKVMLMKSVETSGWPVPIWSALLLSGLTVMLALARKGSILFWKPLPEEPKLIYPRPSGLRTAALIMLVMASPALTIFAGPVSAYSRATAEQLVARKGYIDAVLGASPVIVRERRPL